MSQAKKILDEEVDNSGILIDNGQETLSIEEFKVYYIKHKSEMDSATTWTLNSRFRIEDDGNVYKIRKTKGALNLYRVLESKLISKNDMLLRIKTLEIKVESMRKELDALQSRDSLIPDMKVMSLKKI